MRNCTMLPFIILMKLTVFHIGTVCAVVYAVTTTLVVACLRDSPDFNRLNNCLFANCTPTRSLRLNRMNNVLSHNNIRDVFFARTVIVLTLDLNNLLATLNVLPTLLSNVGSGLAATKHTVFTTTVSTLDVGMLVNRRCLDVLLSKATFQPAFRHLGLRPGGLSHAVRSTNAIVGPLMP